VEKYKLLDGRVIDGLGQYVMEYENVKHSISLICSVCSAFLINEVYGRYA